MKSMLFWIALLAVAIGAVRPAAGQHSNPWLLTWIPARCCVTSDCCFEVSASALQLLPEDQWRVVASGQILKRTDYSPDGKFYRCACGWKDDRNTKSNTYCVFTPLNSM